MKVYVAGPFLLRDTKVKEVLEAVRSAGHEITFDWTQLDNLLPHHQHRDASITGALNMKRGAMEADVLILIWQEVLYGALIETGMALAASTEQNPKKIIILGPKDKVGIFETLPEFSLANSITELIDQLQQVN